MNNKAFNDCIIEHAASRMVGQGYAITVEEAKEWLSNRRAKPTFTPANKSFAERGAVKTLERLCAHAYEVIVCRRTGKEAELPHRVKAYYTPQFQKMVEA